MKKSTVKKFIALALVATLSLSVTMISPNKTKAATDNNTKVTSTDITFREGTVKIGNYKIYIGKRKSPIQYPIYKKNLKTKKKVLVGYSDRKGYYTCKNNIIIRTSKGYLYKIKLTQKKAVKMKNFEKNSRIMSTYSSKYMIIHKKRTFSKFNVSTGKREVITDKAPLIPRYYVLDKDTIFYGRYFVSSKTYGVYSYNLKDKKATSAKLPLENSFYSTYVNWRAYNDSLYFTVDASSVEADDSKKEGINKNIFKPGILRYSPTEGLSEVLSGGTLLNFSGDYMYYYTGKEATDDEPVIHQYNMNTTEDKTIVDTKYLLVNGGHIEKVIKKGTTLTIYTSDCDHPGLKATYTINEDGTNLILTSHND